MAFVCKTESIKTIKAPEDKINIKKKKKNSTMSFDHICSMKAHVMLEWYQQ